MGQLDGQVAIVTGGASGIGARTVELFLEEGCRVLVADMQEERGRSFVAKLGKDAAFQLTEVSQEDQVRAAVEAALGTFGGLDCIFNNAGFGGALGGIHEIPVEEFDLTFDVLVRGVFLGMKHAAPILTKQGSGTIINTASVAAILGGYSPHAYSAAKAAVIQLTRNVALELAAKGVRANCVAPGYIATPLSTNAVGKSDQLVEERTPEFGKFQPIPRPGLPDDIAKAALWLASDASSFVTGQTLVIDGGVTAGQSWDKLPEAFRTFRPTRVYRPPSAGN